LSLIYIDFAEGLKQKFRVKSGLVAAKPTKNKKSCIIDIDRGEKRRWLKN